MGDAFKFPISLFKTHFTEDKIKCIKVIEFDMIVNGNIIIKI